MGPHGSHKGADRGTSGAASSLARQHLTAALASSGRSCCLRREGGGGGVFTGHGSSAWVPRFPTRALPPAMLSFPGGTGSLRLESWQLTCPHPDGALTRVSVVLSTQ